MSGVTDQMLFDATLRPNPPLAVPILRAILIVVATVNLVFALSFVLRGAWPIAPFMGADVALLAWAFHASSVAARRYERVSLTPSRLLVARYPAKGAPSEIALNPYWVRVNLEGPPENRNLLFLRSHGHAVQIGSFLAPPDRSSLADALKAALRRARETRPE